MEITQMIELTNEFKNKFFIEFSNCHNNKKGTSITMKFEDEAKKQQPATLKDAIDLLYNKACSELQTKQWYTDVNSKILTEAHTTNTDYKTLWKEVMLKELNEFLVQKQVVRDEYTQTSLPDAFGGDFLPCKFDPKHSINEIDLLLIKGVVYCTLDNSLYINYHDNYIRLGDFESVTDRKSNANRMLFKYLSQLNSERVGREFYDLWEELYTIADKITDAFFLIRRQCENSSKNKTNADFDISLPWVKEPVKINEFLQCDETKPLPFNWYNELHSAFAKEVINHMLPASMINNDLMNLYYEAKDDEFKRYAIKPSKGSKCTFSTYLSKLFEESNALSQFIPKIDVLPRIITDEEGVCARFRVRPDWEKDLFEQYTKYDECKILKTFLEPYTDNEKLAIMGWAYTVLHPSCPDNINFLFKTGGGTFKTNYFAEQIKILLRKMYQPDYDLVHVMLRDLWVTDVARRELANGCGISTAALVFNDECTDKCLEEFKAMSGGSTDTGEDYQCRIMRENPKQMKIYCKWLFNTNTDFMIQDTTGAFDRRLFIISRMDVRNLNKPYQKNEFHKYLEKETKMFYETAKKSYEAIRKRYGTLEAFVTTVPEISKNLKDAYNEEEKMIAYYNILDKLKTAATKDVSYNANEHKLIVTSKMFNSILKDVCEDLGIENTKGVVKWIKNTDKCEQMNVLNTSVRLTDENVKSRGARSVFTTKVNKGHKLYDLKQSYYNNIVQNSEEIDLQQYNSTSGGTAESFLDRLSDTSAEQNAACLPKKLPEEKMLELKKMVDDFVEETQSDTTEEEVGDSDEFFKRLAEQQ